jgi:hypothetical protein
VAKEKKLVRRKLTGGLGASPFNHKTTSNHSNRQSKSMDVTQSDPLIVAFRMNSSSSTALASSPPKTIKQQQQSNPNTLSWRNDTLKIIHFIAVVTKQMIK